MVAWNPRKIAFLRQYREAVLRIADRTEELERIRQRMLPGAQHISDMPGGGKRSDWTDTVATLIELERIVHEELAALVEKRDRVVRIINSVPDDRYRALLDKRYISGKTYEQIAEEMGVETITIWRWHGAAIDYIEI